MKLAQRIQGVLASSTLAITAKAKKLHQDGLDVINLAAGEPDFDTPEFIKKEAIKAIEDGFTKYTPTSGIPELKKAIQDKFLRENNLNYTLDQIVVSSGAKHSIYNTLQVLVERGDEVIIPSPYWVSYPEMVKLAEGKPIFLETLPSHNFKLKINDLLDKISSKTKLIILNSPSNPTGSVYTQEELEAIAKVCVEKNIYCLSDEIYEKLVYDSAKHISIGGLNNKIFELTITVNGVSKSFSMTGWRIGYLGAPKEISESISRLQDHSTSNPGSISQKASLAALLSGSNWIEQMREEFQKRRDIMISYLDKIPQISYIKPQGAFYFFCDISQLGLSSQKFAMKILEEAQVALIPGDAFGWDNFIRISFATGIDRIKEALTRINQWVKQYLKKS